MRLVPGRAATLAFLARVSTRLSVAMVLALLGFALYEHQAGPRGGMRTNVPIEMLRTRPVPIEKLPQLPSPGPTN